MKDIIKDIGFIFPKINGFIFTDLVEFSLNSNIIDSRDIDIFINIKKRFNLDISDIHMGLGENFREIII